jgi:hypothetical protein
MELYLHSTTYLHGVLHRDNFTSEPLSETIRRRDSLDGWSVRRKAAAYTEEHKHRYTSTYRVEFEPSVRAEGDISCLHKVIVIGHLLIINMPIILFFQDPEDRVRHPV